MKKLTKREIDLICEYLGERAMQEAEKGNIKREKRIFELINKLESLEK
jgi:hypothetical protein